MRSLDKGFLQWYNYLEAFDSQGECFDAEQTATIERNPDLYTIRLPPNTLMCANAVGVMRLLNRTRSTVWTYIKTGRLRSFSISGNIAVPLVDIAAMLGTTETQIYNIAIAHRLPLWQIYLEGG